MTSNKDFQYLADEGIKFYSTNIDASKQTYWKKIYNVIKLIFIEFTLIIKLT